MKSKKTLKKLIFSLALATGLALGTAAVCSFADTITIGNVKYNYDTRTKNATVSRYQNTSLSGEITIPNTITI